MVQPLNYGGCVRLATMNSDVWEYCCSLIHRQNFEQQMPLDSKQEGGAYQGLFQNLVELLNSRALATSMEHTLGLFISSVHHQYQRNPFMSQVRDTTGHFFR
jgi:hypothetical protein